MIDYLFFVVKVIFLIRYEKLSKKYQDIMYKRDETARKPEIWN